MEMLTWVVDEAGVRLVEVARLVEVVQLEAAAVQETASVY